MRQRASAAPLTHTASRRCRCRTPPSTPCAPLAAAAGAPVSGSCASRAAAADAPAPITAPCHHRSLSPRLAAAAAAAPAPRAQQQGSPILPCSAPVDADCYRAPAPVLAPNSTHAPPSVPRVACASSPPPRLTCAPRAARHTTSTASVTVGGGSAVGQVVSSHSSCSESWPKRCRRTWSCQACRRPISSSPSLLPARRLAHLLCCGVKLSGPEVQMGCARTH